MKRTAKMAQLMEVRENRVEVLRRMLTNAARSAREAEADADRAQETCTRVEAETSADFDQLFNSLTDMTDLRTRLDAVNQTLARNAARRREVQSALRAAKTNLTRAKEAKAEAAEVYTQAKVRSEIVTEHMAKLSAEAESRRKNKTDELALEQFTQSAGWDEPWE